MKITIEHTIAQHTQAANKKEAHEALQFSIDLSINEEHNIIGLFGPSGAGKSTIFKILAGLSPNAHYSMQWGTFNHSNERGRLNPCVYVGEDTQLFSHICLLDNLKLVQNQSETHSQSPFSIEEVISLCKLSELISKLPWQLSSGEKQRACFARALLSGKKILLLDEAFSALDWKNRTLFNRILREVATQHDYYVFMVSHSLRELSLCVTKLISIEAGNIVEQAKLSDALRSKLANNEIEHEHYFSAITASFSHIDKQDNTLQVYKLLGAELGVTSQTNVDAIYVKDQLTSPLSNLRPKQNINATRNSNTQTFIVDANKVSISKTANHQTSMVNCLPVNVLEITHINSGVLVMATQHTQILRSIITTKSFVQLNIKVGDSLWFVFKAL